jgi:hypothetical protein
MWAMIEKFRMVRAGELTRPSMEMAERVARARHNAERASETRRTSMGAAAVRPGRIRGGGLGLRCPRVRRASAGARDSSPRRRSSGLAGAARQSGCRSLVFDGGSSNRFDCVYNDHLRVQLILAIVFAVSLSLLIVARFARASKSGS